MLRKITLENFFSFGKPTTIELNPDLNILVGINGSGKSNFLKAIYLLKEGIRDDGFRRVFLQEWGGFSGVAHSGSQSDVIRLEFEFESTVAKESLIYLIYVTKVGQSDYSLSEELNNNSLSINDKVLRIGSFLEYKELTDQIRNLSYYSQFDTSAESPLRQGANFNIDRKISRKGENVVSLLNMFNNENFEVFEQIETFLKKVNPNFKSIKFNVFGSKTLLAIQEKNLNRTISIEHISDGTLRFLILLAIFLNPERGSAVCMDEPTLGMHPDMIHSIGQLIKIAAKQSQMIVVTHSPLLLNEFELDEIIVFEKDSNNQTKATIKSEEDFPGWNDNFLVGQAWLSGLIGGKRW